MPIRRATSQRASRDDPSSDDSSSRGDDFVIAPRPRRETRKASEEATKVVEGQAVRDAREARASDIIQKVEHPLWADYEYTLRRVDYHHPRRPTNFSREEN
jgi:hypothetical protein